MQFLYEIIIEGKTLYFQESNHSFNKNTVKTELEVLKTKFPFVIAFKEEEAYLGVYEYVIYCYGEEKVY